MKILTLLGLLVLLTTSPTTNCIPGQFKPPPIPYYSPVPVAGSYSGFGSNFGFLALAIIVFSILLLLPPRCPSGYTLYSTKCGQFCYRFEAQNCKSWSDARAACQAEGADLWVPDTCSYPFFQGLAKENAASCTDFWIGGFRTPPSTNYMTVQGAPIPNDFQFWAPRQPSLAGSAGGVEACVQMADELRYLMNDDRCGELAGYICQKFV